MFFKCILLFDYSDKLSYMIILFFLFCWKLKERKYVIFCFIFYNGFCVIIYKLVCCGLI